MLAQNERENSRTALHEFKCKNNCKLTKAKVDFIYNDCCKNPFEICFVDFSREKPELSILFEDKSLESKFYSNYNANYQAMEIHKDTLTINAKDEIGTNLQIKITPFE